MERWRGEGQRAPLQEVLFIFAWGTDISQVLITAPPLIKRWHRGGRRRSRSRTGAKKMASAESRVVEVVVVGDGTYRGEVEQEGSNYREVEISCRREEEDTKQQQQ